jgi:hypothetical protein
MMRLVEAIPILQQRVAGPLTLIGGLAVLARLSTPHRATSDIDTARRVDGRGPSTVELLLQGDGRLADAVGVVIPTPRGDVKVDAIDVGPADSRPRSNDPNDVLYALAHMWAIDTAEDVELVASPQGDPITCVRAILPVATPGPLVATKLQSAMNRGSAKEAVDLLDIITLVTDPAAGPTALEQLSGASAELAEAARTHVVHWFRNHAGSSLRAVKRLPEGRAADLDIIRDVGQALLAALTLEKP